MGGQPLYEVKVELLDATGQVLIVYQRMALHPARSNRPTRSRCTLGQRRPFFAKEANWIPADSSPRG